MSYRYVPHPGIAGYRPAFNAEFAQPSLEEGTAFVPFLGGSLDDILCEQFERTVGKDNCVRFEGLTLQIPSDRHRCHYVTRPKCMYIATRIAPWRFFTAPDSWWSMMRKERISNQKSRTPRNSASRRPRRETASGYRPPPFPGA